jgi:ribosomal protein L11 methyltransferase
MTTSPSLPLLYAAHVETSARLADLYDAYCAEEADDACTAWLEADKDRAILEYFCATPAEAEHRLAAMEALLAPHRQDDPWTADVRELPSENWTEAWKRFFHAEKVSDRIWIKPSWESCAPAAGDIVVELDPGMSFGTGQHGTTRGCLRVMDALARTRAGGRLADLGCGSGILAIAAAKLGFGGILALDNDPAAVRIATENAGLNGVAGRIAFVTGELDQAAATAPHGVIVANILAPVLVANAGLLTHCLARAPEARLVLSGILVPQAAAVRAAYEALGLIVEQDLVLGEWTTLCLRW